uniref:Uncharacterized protein LOC105124742 isoform X1 n=1 Tax=Rhizophora mucronata TaxID=61149 RepID=A0A2P2JY42_RHIMU
MPEASRFSRELSRTVDPTDHLPLSLLNLEAIPPAPTRSASAIDWIPDFAGYSWVAYGASSLLVISHFPSPLSREEAMIGPILRQVFELSGDQTSRVSAVSWSPVTPSVGELAAASENHIFLFSLDSASSTGSFSWSQNAVLVQSSKVEAIKWSGSGDGIISGGMDVVLWRRRNRSWEIAWKFRRDEPQNLVSATWSIWGLSASAAYMGEPVNVEGSFDTSKSVLVCYGDGISECTTRELRHPQPVSMVQWRPLTESHLQEYTKHSPRQMLLTCCLDGAARLWTEVDNGKVRKSDKDYDCKIMRRSFCVAAVIEINQALNGTLGMDIFLNWATEIGGIYKNGEGGSQLFSAKVCKNDKAGKCEWLIGFGPGTSITFWAVHCLDDISPMRFPRVTLWKRQELQELEMGHLQKAGLSKLKDWLLLNKVVILRTFLSGPPNVCSLLHLLPCNSLVWFLLDAQTSSNSEVSKIENHLSCSTSCVFGVGHTGKILQIAMHPQIYEVELAVSLDTNGLLLFWFISNIPSCNMNLPTLLPSWKLCGQKLTCDMCAGCTSLTWAPSTLGEDLVLLLGHHGGIDCFLIKVSQIQEGDILSHFLCTIPATGHDPNKCGPTDMFAIPMPPTCNKTFKYHKFLLLGVWTKEFQALSWEVTLHSYDLPQSCCECNFDGKFVWKFEKTFASRVYCLGVKPCSSQFPEPHFYKQITSFSVVLPGNLIPKQESLGFNENLCCSTPAYTMATGCSDGSVKLWKSNPSNLSPPSISWEMVGKFAAHQGPISSICLADTGRKIATICKGSHLDRTSIIRIWDSVHLMKAGSFILEDTISIDGDVFNLNWLTLGNGHLVLGVCLQNELQVYAQRCSGGQILLNHEKSLNLHNWACIAVAQNLPAACNFYWGPKSTAIIVHDSYFSIVSPWLFLADNKKWAKSLPKFVRVDGGGGKDKDFHFSIFADCDTVVADLNEPFVDDNKAEHNSKTLVKVKVQNDKSPSSFVARYKQNHDSSDVLGFWNLVEVAEQVRGILPIYHPQALLMNIYSGNWRRAYVSVRHLVECLTLHCASEKSHSFGKHGHMIPQILLSNYFEGIVLKDSTDNGFQWSADARLTSSSSQFSVYNLTSDLLDNMFSSSAKSELSGFDELIEKLHDSVAIDKLQILAIIDLLSEVQHSGSAYKNLDEPGQRFWVTLRFQQLHFVRSFGRLPSVEELNVDSRLMSLAFQSDCHETLLSFFLPNEPLWKDMQTLGVGFWFTNTSQLRARMEKLARIQYLRNKDPKDCALLYIALNRLQVLAGLFKISKDEKDKPLVGFLSRNFQEEKNKAAALKNAYVLMGRHQLELAIAFFLLGGDAYSAITVCVKNLRDEQLALVICRLLEGCGGPLEHHLITKLIAPSARKQGDYWLASLLEVVEL